MKRELHAYTCVRCHLEFQFPQVTSWYDSEGTMHTSPYPQCPSCQSKYVRREV